MPALCWLMHPGDCRGNISSFSLLRFPPPCPTHLGVSALCLKPPWVSRGSLRGHHWLELAVSPGSPVTEGSGPDALSDSSVWLPPVSTSTQTQSSHLLSTCTGQGKAAEGSWR